MPNDRENLNPGARHELHLPHVHIGLRKVKSLLAIFVGFCIWQLIRIFLPGLEVHPIFIYIYGILEIRDSSAKTVNMGRMRLIATFTALSVGLPFMLFTDWLRPMLHGGWVETAVEISMILVGVLTVLVIAELVKCGTLCGLAAGIFVILMKSHFESAQYLYSVLRAFQTVIGVFVAWLINVRLLPYPPTKGSLSYWLAERRARKGCPAAGALLEVADAHEINPPPVPPPDPPAGVF